MTQIRLSLVAEASAIYARAVDTPWPFAARAAELARVTAVADDLDAAGLLILGGAGAGKSRLLAEALRSVERPAVQVRAGQAQTVRFGAFAHLLPPGVGEVEEATAAILPGEGRLLVVADDAGQLDVGSSQLLRALVESERVTLLAAVPEQPVRPDPLAELPVVPLEPPGREDIAELVTAALGGGPVAERTVRALHRMAGGDLRLLRELVRVGTAGGTLIRQPEGASAIGWLWRGDVSDDPLWEMYERSGPGAAVLPAEGAIALAAVLAGTGLAEAAEAVLADMEVPADDGLRAVHTIARAAYLAWGLGRTEAADRLLATALDEIADPVARARVRCQMAAADLHRARIREALDGAEEAAEPLTGGGPAVRAEIASVQALAAALTGQTGTAATIAERALDRSSDWIREVPDCLPYLSYAQITAHALAGGPNPAARSSGDEPLETGEPPAAPGPHALSSGGEPFETGEPPAAQSPHGRSSGGDPFETGEARPDGAEVGAGPDAVGDAVERAAARAQVHRLRGRMYAALHSGWDGARRLRTGTSIFAGPCLGEIVQAAAVVGDLGAARAALTEADRRAVPALRTMWFPVALARPWLLAAEGMLGAAVHDLLGAAAAAETLELRRYELFALHDVVRLGAAGVVADRLAGLAEDVDGVLAPLAARHAEAAAAHDAARLASVSEEFERLGMVLYAAEAAAQASAAHWDKGVATELSTRAWVMVQRCEGVRTPALRTVVPGLSMLQQQAAELAAAGRSDTEIAAVLDISVRSVAEHLAAAGERLGVPDREALAVLLRPAYQPPGRRRS